MNKGPWLIGLLAIAALGCNGEGYEGQARVGLPAGDVDAGRQVFTTHGCTLCHRATGETDLPAPTSSTASAR